MSHKLIKSESWYIKTLAGKVNNGEIYKPKFQRKRKWNKLPTKANIPNEKEFIEFLFDTNNSVHPIAFGQEGSNLLNIDGNNRINTITDFLVKPLSLFSDKLYDLEKFLSEKSESLAHEVVEIMKEITYEELMSFKYNKYFIEKGFVDLYNNNLKHIRDDAEIYFDDLVNKLKINGKDRFDNDVHINVNIFIGYSTEELADVFSKINQYNSGLTEQEALASRLYNKTDFLIENKKLEFEIKQHIKKYYQERTKEEILKCFTYDDSSDSMNAYDFIVGFQNYANSKCLLIQKTDNDGLSLFFKLYKNLFSGSFDNTFTTKNVNEYIRLILDTMSILKTIEKCIFMDNFVGEKSKVFDSANKKLKSLKKNNLYLIISSIFGYFKNNTPDYEIVKSIEKCILYHFFVNNIENKENKKTYRIYDGIAYEAGGRFIDNKAKEYLKKPYLISERISKEQMIQLLEDLISENIKTKIHDPQATGRKNCEKQRRSRKLFEKVLIYYYYHYKVPTHFLHNQFWIEHIFPFSCTCDSEIDIDRLGNTFPILKTLNVVRSNKHINTYYKIDTDKFIDYIDVIPHENLYNQVISHDKDKPHIFNIEEYNNICSKNEKILIDCFVRKTFS